MAATNIKWYFIKLHCNAMKKYSKQYNKTKRRKFWGWYIRQINFHKRLGVKNFEDYCKMLLEVGR